MTHKKNFQNLNFTKHGSSQNLHADYESEVNDIPAAQV